MGRLIAAAIALALTAPVLLMPVTSRGSGRALPMHFSLRLQGPADACGDACRLLVAASGGITAETPREFAHFAKAHDLAGALVVLESDGGSVHGAMALGRQMRKLGLDATVGRLSDLGAAEGGVARAKISPRADCESMCTFVLLAGVKRAVPREARVMVHQIWLGDRRDDPTAANYSAEDLVLVQRDIGRLAQYTAEMGASIELLDIALRIPPWEPMHALTPAEIERTKLATQDQAPGRAGTVATSRPAPTAQPLPRMTDGVHKIGERRWAMIERKGQAALARSHPLTVAGEEIGRFDLMLACGADAGTYDVSYVERRRATDATPLADELAGVVVLIGRGKAKLKVASSEHRSKPDELVTYAAGPISAKLIDAFAAGGNHSMTVATKSGRLVTRIRLGNTGAMENLPRLAVSCRDGLGTRADAPPHKAGALASATP